MRPADSIVDEVRAAREAHLRFKRVHASEPVYSAGILGTTGRRA